MADAERAPLDLDGLARRARAAGAAVPSAWLALLTARKGWAVALDRVSPLTGRALSAQAWAFAVFAGLLSACGARWGTRARALAFDLAASVVDVPVLGPVPRRRVGEAVQKSACVRALLRKLRPEERPAACLLALESCGALAETPAMVEEARWRLGPGSDATDALAIGALVADVVWHCHEDAAALLRDVAARAVATGGGR